MDEIDGLSVEYPTWRFNVRMSNTEPVVRLNVETRADKDLLQAKTEELISVLGVRPVRVALAQVNPTVGALEANGALVVGVDASPPRQREPISSRSRSWSSPATRRRISC